jgi:hypothetical protein
VNKEHECESPNVCARDFKAHKHGRGRPGTAATVEPCSNKIQTALSLKIRGYLDGSVNKNEFKVALAKADVPIDDKLQKMIQKNEIGDKANYHQMGSHVFRQLNGSIKQNQPDKIGLNNKSLIEAAKQVKSFGYADKVEEAA